MNQTRKVGRRLPARRSTALMLAAGTCLAVSAATAAPSRFQDPVQHPWIELNGEPFHIQKVIRPGEGTEEVIHIFHDATGRALTWDELQAHIAAQSPRIITPALESVLAQEGRGGGAAPDQAVDIFIVLRNQPGSPISREVWARVAQDRQTLARGMRQISGRPLQRPSMPELVERDFIPLPLTRGELEERRVLAEALDELESRARREIHASLARAIATDQDDLARAIGELGGEVTARITAMNIVGAALTPAAIRQLATHPLVAQIDLDHPGESELDNSRLALLVHTGFWANNISGGIFDAGVLDTGVQMNHPALSSHPFLSNMGSTDTGDHGTHVAGIMVSTDATHRGMAFGADHIIFARAGSITTSMPGMDYIASTGEADICNYSFGNGTASTNDYTPTDQFFDGVISTFSYLVSKSTGNGGFGTGNPTITHPAPAFNLLACANINDVNTPTRNDDWIASSSSRGPTAGGRRKPDIGAPGSAIMSANKNWATGAHFISKTGTSMAAPHVGGAVLLLYDMGVNSTIASKAVLINTADAIEDNGTSGTGDDQRIDGSRWNRRYGWGYMHLGKAYLNGLDVFESTVATASPRDRFRLYAGQMFDHEKATLVWERHVAHNGSTYPTQIETLSDLDLFAYRESDSSLLASSASAIDNVEQLSIPAGQGTSGIRAVLKVKAVGSFSQGIQNEPFAVAAQENFAAVNGPAFGVELIHPASAEPLSQFVVRANITNTGDLAAHGVTATFTGAIILDGQNPINIGTVDAAATPWVEWTVLADEIAGSHPISVNIVSNSYGEAFAGAGNSSYSVSRCYANCDDSTLVPILNVDDFTCFINEFASAQPLPHQQQVEHYANCDGSTAAPALNVDDFTCFINAFAAGCP